MPDLLLQSLREALASWQSKFINNIIRINQRLCTTISLTAKKWSKETPRPDSTQSHICQYFTSVAQTPDFTDVFYACKIGQTVSSLSEIQHLWIAPKRSGFLFTKFVQSYVFASPWRGRRRCIIAITPAGEGFDNKFIYPLLNFRFSQGSNRNSFLSRERFKFFHLSLER